MMWNILSYFILILSYSYQSQEQYDVKISVYYETLCPDSIKFINEQLFPVYKNIGKPLSIDLIPYGFASVNNNSGTLEFNCQHGQRECHGNKYHSCAIALFSEEESTEFVACSMSKPDPASDEVLRKCSEKTGVSWASLETCFNSGQADKLLLQNGARTSEVEPKITFIPTIVFNDHFNQTLQDESLTNLQELICDFLQNEPDSCKKAEEISVILLK